MKKIFLCRGGICGFILAMAMLVASPCVYGASSGTSSLHWGMSQSQASKYDKLEQQKLKSLEQINNKVLSATQHDAALVQLDAQFAQQVKNLLNVQQFAAWKAEADQNTAKDKRLQDIYSAYAKAYYASYPTLSERERWAKYASLESDAINKMAEVVGVSDAEATFRTVDIQNRINGQEIQSLQLTYNNAWKLADLKADQHRVTRQLWTSGLTRKQIAAKQQVNKAEFDKNVAQLLGGNYYQQWKTYISEDFDRRCKNMYNMNDVQIAKFKELMSANALDILKIQRNSQMPKDEKIARIAKANNACMDKAREFLTAEQVAKVEQNRKLLEQRKEKNRNGQ